VPQKQNNNNKKLIIIIIKRLGIELVQMPVPPKTKTEELKDYQ
jgi:hypothetical protein